MAHSRGSSTNPTSRFEALRITAEDPSLHQDFPGEPTAAPRTRFFKDHSETILTTNESPDVGFTASVNPYRGCEHGCVYCYARPTHEYLGLSAGLDFETQIFVKESAPELLREKLSARAWIPKVVNLSGVTDCYQPIERKLRLTRRCAEVLAEFCNPFTIITKNYTVTRDIDVFKPMAEIGAVGVMLSITTLQNQIAEVMEPRTSRPAFRLKALEQLARAGIPCGVMVAPLIPGLTDHEMPAILKAAANAGAQFAEYTVLRLPYGVGDLFTEWLARHFPDRKDKVLSRIRELRDGKMNDANFGSRMKGQGVFANQFADLFRIHTRREGLNQKPMTLSTEHFRKPRTDGQLDFFSENL